MRLLAVLLAATFGLSACNLIYKLPTRQGNVIEQKQLDQLALGMSRDQVKFLLGTPLAASPFREERWDYVGYYKSPRGQVSSRTVTLYFDGNALSRMEGIKLASGGGDGIDTPDVKTVIQQEKKSRTEESREASEEGKDSGVTITPQ